METLPSHSLRVVNSLPAQIDQIRMYSNCHIQYSSIDAILHVLCNETAMSVKQTESGLLPVVVSWQ